MLGTPDLRKAVTDAMLSATEAKNALCVAWARIAKYEILALEEKGIVTFSFEATSEYNDEGGYDMYTSLTFYDAAGDETDKYDNSLEDLTYEPPYEMWGLLVGDAVGADYGKSTLADLRTRTFA